MSLWGMTFEKSLKMFPTEKTMKHYSNTNNPVDFPKQTNEHGYCPSCGLDLDGGLIWQHFLKTMGTAALADEYAAMYGATRTTGRWGLATGMYDSKKDRTVGWTCPQCDHYWGVAINMNQLHLNKLEVEEILEFINKYPDVHMTTLHWDNSSGIGKTLTAEIRTYLKDDYVSITKTITDQTSW